MAQFIPFSSQVLVDGQAILSVINALKTGEDYRRSVLEKHGIIDPQAGGWYPQDAYLKAFEEIANAVGPVTLFSIGKAIPENAKFPPEIDTLERALNSIQIAYSMSHKGGEIGSYKLIYFNDKEKKATMKCENPYPSEMDRGLITTMLRKFRPKDSMKYDVILNTSLPSRLNAGESCTYDIFW